MRSLLREAGYGNRRTTKIRRIAVEHTSPGTCAAKWHLSGVAMTLPLLLATGCTTTRPTLTAGSPNNPPAFAQTITTQASVAPQPPAHPSAGSRATVAGCRLHAAGGGARLVQRSNDPTRCLCGQRPAGVIAKQSTVQCDAVRCTTRKPTSCKSCRQRVIRATTAATTRQFTGQFAVIFANAGPIRAAISDKRRASARPSC